jgi:AAA+ superfamily predicted ATPase
MDQLSANAAANLQKAYVSQMICIVLPKTLKSCTSVIRRQWNNPMIRRALLLKTSFGSTDTVQENSWNLLETTKWLEMHSHGSNNGITAFSERCEAKREQEMMMKMLIKTNIVGQMKKYWLFATFRTATFNIFLQVLLLSGPPGLGKTTLAHVLAKQAGYEVLEINARLVKRLQCIGYQQPSGLMLS